MDKKIYTLEEIKSHMLANFGRKFFVKINDRRRSLSTNRYEEIMRNGLTTVIGSEPLQQKISILRELLPEFRIEAKNSGVNADADVANLKKYLEELLSCKDLYEVIVGYSIYFTRFSIR